MRNCFVPWCDRECRANPKRMMFNAPKDEDLFQKWSDVLPKKRIFKKSDKVCERHFKVSDINTTFDHVINGELFKMARGRPKLNLNVIPSRNLPSNDIEPVKRGRSKKTKLSIVKKQKLDDNQEDEQPGEVVLEYNNILLPSKTESEPQTNELNKLNNQKINEDTSEKTNQKDEIEKLNEEETQDLEFFEEIYEDIFEVVLPSTLWGIHRDPNKEFIAFTYYDPKFHTTSKVVELTNKAILKVIMCSKIVSVENYYSEITYDTITNILNETDQARVCKMAIENLDLCQIKVSADSNDEYCQMCSQLKSS